MSEGDEVSISEIAKAFSSKLDEQIKDVTEKRLGHQNLLAQAFIEAVGAPVTDIELVEIQEGTTIRWFFRKRSDSNV